MRRPWWVAYLWSAYMVNLWAAAIIWRWPDWGGQAVMNLVIAFVALVLLTWHYTRRSKTVTTNEGKES